MDDEDREDTDIQPWQMARPILVITGHTGHFDDFVPHRIYHATITSLRNFGSVHLLERGSFTTINTVSFVSFKVVLILTLCLSY